LQNVFSSLKKKKNAIKNKKTDIEMFVDFVGKSFDIDFLQKYFDRVFELSLPRNAQKRTKKKAKKQKKSAGGWVGLEFSKCTGAPRLCPFPVSPGDLLVARISRVLLLVLSVISFLLCEFPSLFRCSFILLCFRRSSVFCPRTYVLAVVSGR
jgi:hypothetical protein